MAVEAMTSELTRAEIRTVHPGETALHMTPEIATKRQEIQTREALLVTGGSNKTDRGRRQLPLTWRHLDTEATTMKGPRERRTFTLRFHSLLRNNKGMSPI